MFEWNLRVDPRLMPTRDEMLTGLIRTLAGPYPGPNRVTLATLLALQYLRLRDEGVAAGQYQPLRGEEPPPCTHAN